LIRQVALNRCPLIASLSGLMSQLAVANLLLPAIIHALSEIYLGVKALRSHGNTHVRSANGIASESADVSQAEIVIIGAGPYGLSAHLAAQK
jgi:hypothetical protein